MNSQAWPAELIEHLVDHRMRVIRFDNRDSGKSTWFGKNLGGTDCEFLTGFAAALNSQKFAQTDSKPTQFPSSKSL